MRIKPPREKSSSSSRNKKLLTYLIGIFIIMIMVLSAMDLWQGSGDSSVYHNVKFTKEDAGWSAYINSNKVLLSYDPQELENISDVDFSAFNSLQKIYVSTDNPLAMYKSMDYFRKRVPLTPPKVIACTPESANIAECEDLPLKGCDDADNSMGVIVFKKSENFTSSFVSSTCLVISGENDVIMKSIDKSMLKMLGV